MRYLFLLSLAAAWLPAASQPKSSDAFTITGQVTNLKEGMVYLRYTNKEGKYVNDSAALQNGAFHFSGAVAEPTMAGFSGKTTSRNMDDPNYTGFFLAPGKINIVVADQAFKEAKITGAVVQQEYASLRAEQSKVIRRWKVVMDTLHEVNKRSNFEYQELKDWVLTPYDEEMNDIQAEFVKKHPASYVTAYLLRFSRTCPTDSLKKVYAAFPAAVKQSSYGKAIAEALENRKKGVPGAVAAGFSTTDINGQPLSLADFKGKYVLVDFWASWCVPCRKGNPHLKELYAQYKDKGFEVIGVSDDDSKPDAWRTAVAKDALPWKHVLRGMKVTRDGDKMNIDRSKDISAGYNVSSLPTQILIGPDGTIIGRYGEGADEHAALDEKLQTVFK
ncbi:MAG TPA: TlpA disulfide reductase family protein [Chitinophagaceae bacterium]|nr:TlpA disulfide reductase family protein [Chitinophagaceae bacterium]